MKQQKLFVLGALWVFLIPGRADAQGLTLDGATTLPGQSQQTGLGLKLGVSSGLTLKHYFTEAHALDVSVGTGLVGGTAMQADVSYLYHIYLTENRHLALPVYFGGGGRVNVWPDEGRYLGADDEGALGFGLFAPMGVAFNLKRVPVDLFAQVSTGFGVVPDAGNAGLLIDFAMGARVYF